MSRCVWCGDAIDCITDDTDKDWHKDACCSCAQVLVENKLVQLELEFA